MASTYSTALKLELMATGDQSGTWGNTTNTNLGTLLEQAITGVLSVAQGDVANLTLTSLDGASDQARNAVVNLTGALTAGRNVVVPTSNKVYLIKNSTTGGFAVTVKTAAGTGVAVAAGTSQWVYCDGTNVVQGLVGTLATQTAAAVAITGGTITGLTSLTLASGAATPAANDAAALGTSTLMWSDLFLASGAVVNWNNGDATLTHSANLLAFAGASSGYSFDAAVKPSADDAAALGVSGTAWADLFLASGGVINWNAGDVTITHSANTLAFAGASSGYTFDVPIAVASGGTGLATLTANNVMLGNGTSAPLFVAPSTSGNVLTSNGTTWQSTAPAASASYTLLGTLTTTSGTTQSLTGIAAGYRLIFCEIEGVSFSAGGAALTIATSSTNGAAYGTAGTISDTTSAGSDVFNGVVQIYNVGSTVVAAKVASSALVRSGAAGILNVGAPSNTAAVVDAIRFAGGTFDAGTIRIYGVK